MMGGGPQCHNRNRSHDMVTHTVAAAAWMSSGGLGKAKGVGGAVQREPQRHLLLAKASVVEHRAPGHAQALWGLRLSHRSASAAPVAEARQRAHAVRIEQGVRVLATSTKILWMAP